MTIENAPYLDYFGIKLGKMSIDIASVLKLLSSMREANAGGLLLTPINVLA